MAISRRDLLQNAAGLAALSSVATETGAKVTAASPLGQGWTPRQFKKKPNIVIAIFDDVGFGDFGCFGSDIDTRTVNALAENGLRYNNFHVTALCAPTRACLMTGQNAHKVGVGNIAEWGRPLPGYKGYIRKDVKLLPQMLKDAGYNTLAVGKWHMSMVNDQDAMGPFDHWPMGRGFDHWYGFHGSAVDHFHPEIFRNQSQVYPEKSDNYHLTEDLVDQSIAYVKDHKVATPEKPFFLYLGFGACHFPFHAPQSYLDKYKGKFSQGYDALRAPRLERQKELGVVPKSATLSSRPADMPAWDALPAGEKKFSERTQEAFAAMLDHADDQFGRFVDNLKEMDELDNTILIVMSDNGAGGGYHRAGALDVRRIAYINKESVAEKMNGLEDVGTERSSPLYSTGWSFLGNTPLKRRKGDTYEGGTRTPMIIHWPGGNLPVGSIRTQYHHIIDIVPTLLQMTNSTDQPVKDIDGISMAYSLEIGQSLTRKTHQHYETAGDRAIWADGWKAVTLHQKGDAFEDDVWALYHSDTDFSENNDLAKREPERVEMLKALWGREAAANNVLPLDDDLDGLYAKVAPKPRDYYVFYPDATRFNRLTAPDIYRYDFKIIAHLDEVSKRAGGVILASGDSAAGYELYLEDGYVVFTYVFTRENIHTLRSKVRVRKTTKTISLMGTVSGKGSGELSLLIDDKAAGALKLPNMWKVEALNAGIRCGENKGAPISFSYDGSNPFGGRINHVEVTLKL